MLVRSKRKRQASEKNTDIRRCGMGESMKTINEEYMNGVQVGVTK